jgi:N-acetylglucosamine repressor
MTNKTLGNRDLMRAMNRSIVLNIVRTYGPVARAEIARRSGLSPATITGISAELIEEGLIFEKETGDSSGGRRPILLALNPFGGYVIGIKLTEQNMIGALTDLKTNVLVKKTRQLGERSVDVIVESLAELVLNMLQKAALPKKKLLGVGVGLAGIVDFERGLLRQSPFLGWKDVPLRDLLQERLRVPVYIDNDVNTLTQAEKWFGSGQGIDNFLTITIGRGVGMGIVVNGQFYRGLRGGAGEFGHIVIDDDGPQCECGNRGCLESYVSDPAILREAQAAYQEGVLPTPVENIEALVHYAQQGNPAAIEIFERAGSVLGKGVANLINIFNPQRIIIGGEGVKMWDFLLEAMQTAIDCHVMPGLQGDTEIQVEPWGDDAWARGAASLVLRELFESPIHRSPNIEEKADVQAVL